MRLFRPFRNASCAGIPYRFFQRPTLATSTPSFAPTVADIDINDLVRSGIQGIILDLDNTIVTEDDRYLSPGIENWIQLAKQRGLRFCILSNGKRRHRINYWMLRLDIPALSPARKPLPWGFWKALKQMGLRSRAVVVIGDSLHTDLIGAWFVGCRTIQVASLPHDPHWWETLAGQWLHVPYPTPEQLQAIEVDFSAAPPSLKAS
ncbi:MULTISPECIES: YqeG family HAD IIIA-type phosphatase [unclassified Leptolyngbya]|uniref:YqeG family HAD IIIA-type phosphatase n=1 Tax=unclassified Leptolyngbya TaxID=2650499 RepID=UPI0016850D2C|nr:MULTISPECIES: YqeG family HAD IIIA-type phosphatase [unclassified Leptolyngbya]MBD1912508.1 YqeG family HAD IIIA-type phosphatase [Leptolyngbya sp. FACHB-8]MBD2156481.1 YqeG family HAD IIIA-type phosphatase [Leptolyngbya sp. FACHB-16]